MDANVSSVLLISGDPGRRQKWAEALAGFTVLYTNDEGLADDTDVRVILTDSDTLPDWVLERRSLGQLAVITIGQPGGDESLPDDVTPRELQLACRLLAENVKLRREIGKTARAHRELRDLAFIDPLTGLANRRAWDAELEQRFNSVATSGSAWCLAILDLDHFKKINDNAGHTAGDNVLKATAGAVSHSLRQNDFVARLGGDEFGLLLSGLADADAFGVCQRIRRRVAHQVAESTSQTITASVGYCVFPASGLQTGKDVFTAADHALVRAKQTGRDRVIRSD